MKLPFVDCHILAFLKQLGPHPLDRALQFYFRSHKSLGSKDRKAMADTLFGMMRWKSLLDFAASDSAQQLAFYRKFASNGFQAPAHFPQWARLGVTPFLYTELAHAYGESAAEALCRLFQEEAPTTIRVNPQKAMRDTLLERWPGSEPCGPYGIRLSKREPLFALPEFKQGLFEVQDEGSQRVAALIDAKPGDLILDFCSGSGGKTLAFAPAMQGKGQVFLHDIRPNALQQARQRLKRAGIQNAQFLTPGHPQLARLKGKCNWILLDVPCSGSGTLRRNPDQKWRIDAPMLTRLVQEQRAIFAAALPYLAPTGTLLYATCSLLPQENSSQVNYFTDTFPVALTAPPLTLLPQSKGSDGFFAASFHKKLRLL